ncbi:hypothetical protein E2C01_077698 [Portunus trituberculatus]|uniref:Uncharacterized protein n=1 Tax=Portunus trituberculatus TaxID=210409 RepID=A0A5B7IM04_PORTR|nr:hypothetical protein [Portunus trituberculatus]
MASSNTPRRIATPPSRPNTPPPPRGSFHAHCAILTAAFRGQQAGRACGRGEGCVCAMAGRGVSAPLRGAADWRAHTHTLNERGARPLPPGPRRRLPQPRPPGPTPPTLNSAPPLTARPTPPSPVPQHTTTLPTLSTLPCLPATSTLHF